MPLVSKVYSFVATFISSMILPTTEKSVSGVIFGKIGTMILEWAGTLFYTVCKWFLAFMDFLQYFIQKLIGLDYWLDSTKDGERTLGQATSEDMIFKFLYADSVQKVFRALSVMFVILLIVFTIFQIIKSEWDFMTGDGKSGNSKNVIFRASIKAILLVVIFPIVLIMGIVSSNAILASIIKAVGVDMSETFAGKIFSIAAQPANKYQNYVDKGVYLPTSDQVTFYLKPEAKKVIYFGDPDAGSNNEFREYIPGYKEYLAEINGVKTKKLTINSIFDPLIPREETTFSGFCFMVTDDNGDSQIYFVKAESEEKEKYYYYLVGCLGANVYGDGVGNDNSDFTSIIKDKDDAKDFLDDLENAGGEFGYFQNFDLSGAETITRNICRNSWKYSLVYVSPNKKLSQTIESKGSQSFENFRLGNSDEYGMILYNSDHISGYFDGGQFGVVQSRAEYQVMADVVNFMCDNGLTFYIMNATSPLIEWNHGGSNGYHINSSLISRTLSGIGEGGSVRFSEGKAVTLVTDIAETTNIDETVNALTFLTKYSNNNTLPVENEQDVIYVAKCGAKSELEGARYIICLKDGDEFFPLVNGLEFSVGGKEYTFSSSIYDKNYNGVVWAKGTFDTNTVDAQRGNPTYLADTSTYSGETEVVTDGDGSYYYGFKNDEIRFYTYYTNKVGSKYYAYNPRNVGHLYEGGKGVSIDTGGVGSRTEKTSDGEERTIQTVKMSGVTYDLFETGREVDGQKEYATEDSGICYVLYKEGDTYVNESDGDTFKPAYLTSAGVRILDDDLSIKTVEYDSIIYGEDSGNTLRSTFSIYNGRLEPDGDPLLDINGEQVKDYLGTFMKNDISVEFDSLSEIIGHTKTFKPNWGGEYYNIDVVGTLLSTSELIQKFSAISVSDAVSCCRNEIGEFSGASLFGNYIVEVNLQLWKGVWEIKTGCVQSVSDKPHYSHTFTFMGNGEGITFDYFFDQNVKVNTFYAASKINFVILVVSAVLIIKVLFTSLWGVIKRFYMITLYYLAMPVAASTMPLDGGSRFGNVRNNITQEVLSTYGVLIGLNLFFVVLSPIDEISRTIFTDETIANSGSYFLIKLSRWLSARVLNEMVYILFLLVAFTLINELPQFVTGLTGGKDIQKSGADTMNGVKGALTSAKDMVSGKSLLKGYETAKQVIPFADVPEKAIKGGVKAVGKLADATKKGYDMIMNGKAGGGDGSGGDSGENKEAKDAEKKNKRDGEDGEGSADESQDANGEFENARQPDDADNPLAEESETDGEEPDDVEESEEQKAEKQERDKAYNNYIERDNDFKEKQDKYNSARKRLREIQKKYYESNGKYGLPDNETRNEEIELKKYLYNNNTRLELQRAKALSDEAKARFEEKDNAYDKKYGKGKWMDGAKSVEGLDEETYNSLSDKEKGQYEKAHEEYMDRVLNGKEVIDSEQFAKLSEKQQNQYSRNRAKEERFAQQKAKFMGYDYDKETGTYTVKTQKALKAEERIKEIDREIGQLELLRNQGGEGVDQEKISQKITDLLSEADEQEQIVEENTIQKTDEEIDQELNAMGVKQEQKGLGMTFTQNGKKISKLRLMKAGAGKAKAEKRNKIANAKAEFANLDYNAENGTYTNKETGEEVDEANVNRYLDTYGVKVGRFKGEVRAKAFHFTAAARLKNGGIDEVKSKKDENRKFSFNMQTGEFENDRGESLGTSLSRAHVKNAGKRIARSAGHLARETGKVVAANGKKLAKWIGDQEIGGMSISNRVLLAKAGLTNKYNSQLSKRKAKFMGYKYDEKTGTYTNSKGKKISEEKLNEELNAMGVSQNKLGLFNQHGKFVRAGKTFGLFGKKAAERAENRNNLAKQRAEFFGFEYDKADGTYKKYDKEGNVTETKTEEQMNQDMKNKGIRQRKFFKKGNMSGRGLGFHKNFENMTEVNKFRMDAKMRAERSILGIMGLTYDTSSGLVMTRKMADKRAEGGAGTSGGLRGLLEKNSALQNVMTAINVDKSERKTLKEKRQAYKQAKQERIDADEVVIKKENAQKDAKKSIKKNDKEISRVDAELAKVESDFAINPDTDKHNRINELRARKAKLTAENEVHKQTIVDNEVTAEERQAVKDAVRKENQAKGDKDAFVQKVRAGVAGAVAMSATPLGLVGTGSVPVADSTVSQSVSATDIPTVQQTQNAFVYDESKIAEIVRKVLKGEIVFASQAERTEAAAHYVNYASINDQTFITNKNDAYKNAIVNSIGVKGNTVAGVVAGNAIINYASSNGLNINQAMIQGGSVNGQQVAGLVSDDAKLAMYKSVIDVNQLDSLVRQKNKENNRPEDFAMSSKDQIAIIEGMMKMNLEAVQGKKGIEFAVIDGVGVRTKVAGSAERNEAANNAIKEALTSGKISSEDVVDSIERTGNFEKTTKAVARNYALTLDYTTEESGKISADVSAYHQEVFDRAKKDEDINAEAILEYLMKNPSAQGKNGALERFYSEYHFNAKNANRDEMLMAIKAGVRNGVKGTVIGDLKPEEYSKELSTVVSRRVADGSFKVQAFDMLPKAQQMDLAAHISANIEAVPVGANYAYTDEEKLTKLAISKFKFGDAELVNTFLNSKIEGKEQIVNKIVGQYVGFENANSGKGAEIIAEVKKKYPELYARLSNEQHRSDNDILFAYAKAQLIGKENEFEQFVGNTISDRQAVETIMRDGKVAPDVLDVEALSNKNFVSAVLEQNPDKIGSIVDQMVRDSTGIRRDSDGKVETVKIYNDLIYEIINSENSKWLDKLNQLSDFHGEEGQAIVMGYAKAKILGKTNDANIDNYINANAEMNKSVAMTLAERTSENQEGELVADSSIRNLKERYISGDEDISKLNASVFGNFKAGDIAQFLRDTLPEDQIKGLIKDGSESGFHTLTQAEQNGWIVKIALSDEGARAVLANNRVDLSSKMEIIQFLESQVGEALKERLISKISQEFTVLDLQAMKMGMSEAEIYELVKKYTAELQQTGLYEKSQGSLVSMERVKEAIERNGSSTGAQNIAESAVSSITVLTAEERVNIENKAIYQELISGNTQNFSAEQIEHARALASEAGEKARKEAENAGLDKSAQDLTAENAQISKMIEILSETTEGKKAINGMRGYVGNAAFLNANAQAIAGNGLVRQRAVVDAIWNDAAFLSLKNQAIEMFDKHGTLNNVSAIERDSFIMKNLTEIIRHAGKNIAPSKEIAKILSSNQVEFNPDASASAVIKSLSQGQFEAVVKTMKDDGKTAVSEIRQDIIQDQVASGGLTEIPNLDTMTIAEVKEFNAMKSALEQAYRQNNFDEKFVNIFVNSKTVASDDLINQVLSKISPNLDEARKKALENNGDYMGRIRDSLLNSETYSKLSEAIKAQAKADGKDYDKFSNAEKDEYIKALLESQTFKDKNTDASKLINQFNNEVYNQLGKSAGGASNYEIKQGIPPEIISQFLRDNAPVREQMMRIGAHKPELMFKREHFHEARLYYMMNNYMMRMRFVRMMLRALYKDDELRRMIEDEVYRLKPEMKKQSRTEVNKYMNEHRSELLASLGENKLLQKDKKGNYTLNQTINQSIANRVIDNMEYKAPKVGSVIKTVLKEITKTILGVGDKKNSETDELINRLMGKLDGNEKFKNTITEIVNPTMRDQIQKYIEGNPESIITTIKPKLQEDDSFSDAIFNRYNTAIQSEIDALKKEINRLSGGLSKK